MATREDIAAVARQSEALYRVHDVLSDLAAEFGMTRDDDEWDDVLDELTHHVAERLNIAAKAVR